MTDAGRVGGGRRGRGRPRGDGGFARRSVGGVSGRRVAYEDESKTRYFSHEHFVELAARSRSFETLAAVQESGKGDVVHLSGVERPRRLRAARVSREFFPLRPSA